MAQLGAFLRTVEGGVSHWCPACREMHTVTVKRDPKDARGWTFNHNIEKPTLAPSVKVSSNCTAEVDDKGEWTGKWVIDPKTGKSPPYCCHYFLTDGVLQFQPDCTHALKGQRVPLPPLPDFMRD